MFDLEGGFAVGLFLVKLPLVLFAIVLDMFDVELVWGAFCVMFPVRLLFTKEPVRLASGKLSFVLFVGLIAVVFVVEL